MGHMTNSNTIAVIPARGGSKGIPNKNIMDFCGKPLVAWSIIQALNTKDINSVFVTSDSDEILDVARKYGAEQIKRPSEISGDTATSESAVAHAVEVIDEQIDNIVMLQPTSPLRKSDDIEKALKLFETGGYDSLFSGALLEDFLIWEKNSDSFLVSCNYDHKNRGRRQERKPQYVENGSFYIFKPCVLSSNNRLGDKIGIYFMDFWQSFEIDNPEDVELTSVLFALKLKRLYE